MPIHTEHQSEECTDLCDTAMALQPNVRWQSRLAFWTSGPWRAFVPSASRCRNLVRRTLFIVQPRTDQTRSLFNTRIAHPSAASPVTIHSAL